MSQVQRMNELEKRKSKLKSIETRIKESIDEDSDYIENQVVRYATTGAIIGLTLYGAYRLYKSVTPSKKKLKQDKVKRKARGPIRLAKERVWAIAATFLYEEFKKALAEGRSKVEESIDQTKVN